MYQDSNSQLFPQGVKVHGRHWKIRKGYSKGKIPMLHVKEMKQWLKKCSIEKENEENKEKVITVKINNSKNNRKTNSPVLIKT